MNTRLIRFSILLLVLCVQLGMAAESAPQTGKPAVIAPEAFFGFPLGSDRHIARWDRIVEYYRHLQAASDCIRVVDMGPSTMGNPFLLVIVSAPQNLADLETLRGINTRLSDPRGLSEAEAKGLVERGKAVVCQSMSLHATEIGGTQMAPQLAYELITRRDEETRRILDNVVFLLVPCFNPDGAIMVADWYRKYLGTPYEGCELPWLYHKYTGHDNNRDAFMTNMVESRYMARILFREWTPQAYMDHHHMGAYGARIYVPPYAEPIRPLADPLIWREHSWYGAHIAYKEEEAGLSGVINMAQYSGWGHFGFHWITPFHNIAGMLTESASAKLATPIYIHPDQLEGDTRGFPQYEAQTTFPNPWPGGWWRLADIVQRQKVSAWALLDLAARNKETVLWNAYLKARRQTDRGARGTPGAYVIPTAQHDPLTAVKLVNQLMVQGIEVQRAGKPFSGSDGMTYAAGSYVVSLAQPKMGLIRYLLGRTFYPDNEWTRNRDGSPTRPYDMATDTMAEFMGVRVDPLEAEIPADLTVLKTAVQPQGRVEKGTCGYRLDGRLNDAFRCVNQLLANGVAVWRAQSEGNGLRPGDFFVPAAPEALVAKLAAESGVDFLPVPRDLRQGCREMKPRRVAMYQRYWGGNMDEGWTRFLLEQYAQPYTTVRDAEIRQGALWEKYDVIILPDDNAGIIVGERNERNDRHWELCPPEYRSGIGKEGVAALKAFVQKGGTLVTLGRACQFAIDTLSLRLRNIVAERSSREFWAPGSTLRVEYANRRPLAYGMPERGAALYMNGNPVFEILPGPTNEDYEVVVSFAERDLLQSGWLIGEKVIARKAVVVQARYEKGRVVLFGLRPQHRAQTHATFKLLFNALGDGA